MSNMFNHGKRECMNECVSNRRQQVIQTSKYIYLQVWRDEEARKDEW